MSNTHTISTPSTLSSEYLELIPTVERMGQPNPPPIPPADPPAPQQYDVDQVRDIVADTVQWAIAAFAQGVEQQEVAARLPHLIPPLSALNQALNVGKSFVLKLRDYDGDKNKFHSWW